MTDLLGNVIHKEDKVVYADYRGEFHVGIVRDIIDNHIVIARNNRLITRGEDRFVRISDGEPQKGDKVAYTNILNIMEVGIVTEIKDEDIRVNNKFWTRKEYVKRL